MAKFNRFDLRNKKRNRNKIRSIERDLKIRREEKHSRSSWKTEAIVQEDINYKEYDPQNN